MKDLYLKFIQYILKYYAKKVVLLHRPIVIAITGSVGKTSTKEAIYQVLKSEYGDKVRSTKGNLNAEFGIPLTILGYSKMPNKFIWPVFLLLAYFRTNIKKYPKYLVLEMGVDKPGDMGYYTQIVKPDYAVITSTTPAHMANFETVSDYQKEKISLINFLKEDGIAIVNYDDEKLGQLTGRRIVTVGAGEGKPDYKAEIISTSLAGTEFRINSVGYKVAVKSKMIGNQFVYANLFAFAIAKIFGINLIKAAKSLEKIKRAPGRMNLIKGIKNSLIIDDSYNSNPTSLKAALDLIKHVKHNGRKVAILGNMNELGNMEKESHLMAGAMTKDIVDLAIFVGKNAENMLEGYKDKQSCLIYRNRTELEASLPGLIKENDLILVKASQNNNFFEEIVKKIMLEPEKSDRLLVRQNRMWASKK